MDAIHHGDHGLLLRRHSLHFCSRMSSLLPALLDLITNQFAGNERASNSATPCEESQTRDKELGFTREV